MPRPEKVQAVADIKERIERARAVFLAEYAGLSVKQQQVLRRGLKEQGAEFKVVKMTLARRAAADLEIDELDRLLLGPTGLAFADADPVAAAKALQDFASDHEVFMIKGGLLGSEFLTPERVGELASIEPREVLLAKLAGLFAAPMSNVAALVGALQQEMAGLLQALIDTRGAEPEAPSEPAVDTADAEPQLEAETAEPEPDAEPAPEAQAAKPAPEAEAAEPETAEPEPEADTDQTTDPQASDEAPDEAARDQAEEAEEETETDGKADD